jgi:glycosyltransferase involved in cell wall biosynthesis
MLRLSVIIITHNEEKNIGRCLDSVAKVADEILVVDDYSTDGTAEIVKSRGAGLLLRRFEGYGAQKNAGAEKAGGDYWLFLDADEYLSPELESDIAREKESGFGADAYIMERLNLFCGQWIRHGSWYPDRKLRLVRRGQGSWNDRLVHESIDLVAGTRKSEFRGRLFHNAYRSVGELVRKNDRYSDLAARSMMAQGKKGRLADLIFRPAWTFIHGYLLKGGFLDGVNGWIIAVNVSHWTFLKYAKLMAFSRREKKPLAD